MNLCWLSLQLSSQETKHHDIHISWEQHATMLILEHQFDSKYRMLRSSSLYDVRDADNFSCPSFFYLLQKGINALLNFTEI
jgi:hypothetical protein